MASLQAKADAVRAAVSSTTSCTPATVVSIKELLLADAESQAPTKSRATKATATAASRTKKTTAPQASDQLNSRDKAALATHVINATIKSLTEAAKPPAPAPSTPSKQTGGDVRQSSAKRTLRRSTSAPLSPMQPRALNRVATSPSVTTKPAAKPTSTSPSTGCLATVECARVAFAALRAAKGPIQPGQTDFQLENGMSALVGKLLVLGMHDQALKELRLLKRRFDAPSNAKAANSTQPETSSAATVAELLNFPTPVAPPALPTITTCQIQVLKLIAATKKPAYIEAILPYLKSSHDSSPLTLLSTLAAEGGKEAAKAARQLAALSQIILSLAPSVSSQEDSVAMEPRLSPSPLSAFELQTLAFQTQFKWWKLAGHAGKADDEILSPFLRCLKSFTRRHTEDEALVYKTTKASYEQILQLIDSYEHTTDTSPNSPTSSIHLILGTTSFAAKRYEESAAWFGKLRAAIESPEDCAVRYACISAHLLASSIKAAKVNHNLEELAQSVLSSLEGSLSGTIAELNELLEGLSLARRSAVGRLMDIIDPNSTEKRPSSNSDMLLKAFILRYPHFVRRWMGNAPTKDASPKALVQFDQRRQLVMKSINQTLDATLMIVKCDVQSEGTEWKQLDEVLQHCASLLETLSDPTLSTSRSEQLGGYFVKISSLYFSKFSQLRKQSPRTKEENKQLLQTLSRSIEIIKDRSAAEKEKAQLSTKLEVFADLCKSAGRTDDAVRTLRSICTGMAEDGVMKDVAALLSAEAPSRAWGMSPKTSMLSRTLRQIAKLDKSWTDWTFFLPETERAAVLEHLVHLSSSTSSKSAPLRLNDSNLTALLRIYSLEKYPIRRLRLLLHIAHQNLGDEDEVDEAMAQIEQALRQAQGNDVAEDASLSSFIPHLSASHGCLQAILAADASPSIPALTEAISTWESIVKTCTTKDDIYKKVDDPDSLVDHLHSMSQLVGLRGENGLQLSISQLLVGISRIFAGHGQTTSSALIIRQSQLASQFISVGSYTRALATLAQAKSQLEELDEMPPSVTIAYNLSQAEYLAGVGSTDDALACLSVVNNLSRRSQNTWATSKAHATMTVSMASLLQSIVALQAGDVQDALTQIKQSVRLLSHDWTKLEAVAATTANDSVVSDASTDTLQLKESKQHLVGPSFWSLASPLVRSLLQISSVYAHIGMFQETIYYAETAAKIAESCQSSLYRAEVASWIGSIQARAGRSEEALAKFEELSGLMPTEVSSAKARFAQQQGDFYSQIGEDEKALEYFTLAEETVQSLGGASSVVITTSTAEQPTEQPASVRSRTTRTTKAKATTTTRAQRRGATTSKTKPASPSPVGTIPNDVYQISLLASVMLSRATSLVRQRDWTAAMALLKQVKELPKGSGSCYEEQVATAMSLIGHSMEQIISDPVFSVIQDSTISFPAVSGFLERGADLVSPSKSPPKRGRAVGATRKATKEADMPAFTDALKQAQDLLAEAHAAAMTKSDSYMVRRISALLQNTIILLSTTAAVKKSMEHSGLATVAVDMGHNITWRREQKTLAAATTIEDDEATDPKRNASRRCSTALTSDMAKFQKSYIEMVPKTWSVVSVSLSDSQHDLCITKFQAGHSPFILRLPLERANSRDADTEVYNFAHGKKELLEIIELANETSHSARDFSQKGERNAWWAEREALDTRLKDLLVQIETTWLGGFKGIFSQHQRRNDLLAGFQKSFQKMLDSHLPSRNRTRGKKSTKPAGVSLDPRILDLFIGLGDPTDPDCDFDEALNDLLYFIVDILQFHGERNAYDEIDFDAMVVEMYDALRGYYGALDNKGKKEDGAHTILVLDKALHAFPWESLPCMEGLAVSRVPSLACLRQMISESTPSDYSKTRAPSGHYVKANAGTYMLNPSSDLKNTQAFFQKPFGALTGWTGIVNKQPQEQDFEQALTESEVLLYFGHGSGAQYIRGKTIRRLPKCKPATFLMGCSSAALTAAGEFECYGPVWNYMMAGCPAVVGTLWDVTDRDIDRFAGRAFEEWGLLDKGTFKEASKNKARGSGSAEDDDDEFMHKLHSNTEDASEQASASLVEAVAKARDACRFKYLNAAAVVVYGVPVYIERDGKGKSKKP